MHNKWTSVVLVVFQRSTFALDLLHGSKGICLHRDTKEQKCFCMPDMTMFLHIDAQALHPYKTAASGIANVINVTLAPTYSNAVQIIYASE